MDSSISLKMINIGKKKLEIISLKKIHGLSVTKPFQTS